MKSEEKKKLIALRRKGWSIKQIAKTLNIPKSSVSYWVRDVVLTKEQHSLLKERQHSFEVVEKRRLARLNNELEKRNKISFDAGSGIKAISSQELKILGSVLYWAEGRKRGSRTVSFSNSDPIIIKIMMRFFREICAVSENKFRGHIHTFSHLNAKKCENYWSTVTCLPLSQFYKTYSKTSKASKGKMDTLPYGTLDVIICDVKLFLTIMGWIGKISKLLVL